MWLVLAVPLLMEQAWDDMNAMVWGMTVVELATALVLVAVLVPRGAVYEMLSARPLVAIGKLSYGIYLWHYPVVRYLRADLPWPAVVVLGFIISTALAALSYYTVERLALRRRDAPPRATPVPQGKGAIPGMPAGAVDFAGASSGVRAPWRIWGLLTGAAVAQAGPVETAASGALAGRVSVGATAGAQMDDGYGASSGLPTGLPTIAPVPAQLSAAMLLAAVVGVPADAPVPVSARAPWPVALPTRAYSPVYRMSYGSRAYRFASGRAGAARSAVAQALRMYRVSAVTGRPLRA
jgi:hypothetical protein